MLRTQQIIVKLSERCNINCSYCYYFNGNEYSYKNKPVAILDETSFALRNYAHDIIRSGEIDLVQIIMHGGEPLMIGKSRFDNFCREMKRGDVEGKIELCLQTNALLIDSDWIEIIARHEVRVCTSLDGTQNVHDARRVDHKGRGTYIRTRKGIELLMDAASRGLIAPISCLAVINPQYSGADSYNHLANEIGIRHFDFLFPDETHDTFSGNASEYGRFMIEVYDAWRRGGDVSIFIRTLRSVMSLLIGGGSYLAGFGIAQPNAFTVRSDGTVEFDDFLRTCGSEVVRTGLQISELTVDHHSIFTSLSQEIARQFAVLPSECVQCAFRNPCHGGQITHRFSAADGFQRKSIFCNGLFDLFLHISRDMIMGGFPMDIIISCLEKTPES